MNHGFELFEILHRADFETLQNELNSRIDIGLVAQKMGAKSRVELARNIIEMSGSNPKIVRFCILKDSHNIIGNEILKISFDYRNFEIAKESILCGASLQEIILLCDDKEIEKIGSSIFEMHRRRRAEGDDVIDFFCGQLIGSKQMLKQAIAKEALLHGDVELGARLESESEVIFGSRRATLRKRFRPFPHTQSVPVSLSHAVPRSENAETTRESPLSFLRSLRPEDTAELQKRLKTTTMITTNTVSNLCVNFLANQPLTAVDVLLMGVIVGVIVGIFVGVFVAFFAVIIL